MSPDELTSVDVQRVRGLLGGDSLRRLIERLRRRLARGEPLTGKIQLASATSEERAAIARLMGRLPKPGRSLTVDLDRLARTLVRATACQRLEQAVVAVVGPVDDERALALSRRQQWDRFWREARQRVAGHPAALQWLDELKTGGLLRRMARADVPTAKLLLDRALEIARQAPFPAIRLAELAATKAGDSHALDPGQPLAALVIRFARQLDASAAWKTAAQRRDAWEILGVLCDELSAPVLVLNLRADAESLTGRALNLHAAAGEPYRISIRQLRRHPPRFDLRSCGAEVFVCENPTVVDVAANALGAACRPLICIDGQPKTASRLLLNALTEAGIRIRYHGDFDWDGIRIANTIVRRHGATSWRFNAVDYVVAETNQRLKGPPVAAIWDDDLAPLMTRVDKCVHEENVLKTLLADLRREG